MPTPGGPGSPTWTPTLDQVAAYCTARTLVAQPSGANVEITAFSASTRPTDAQVEAFIADAIAWVLLKTGPVDASLTGSAAACAAVRAAGFVEMRYPERQSTNRGDAITTGEFLLKQADAMRTDLAAANEAVTGTDPEDPDAVLMPVWSFPTSAPYGDLTF